MGLIHIYTGNGKGKTTAAIGLSIRFAGNGGKVIFTQFLKDNRSSEMNILSKIPQITFIPSPKTFGFYMDMSKEEKMQAKELYTKQLEEVIDMVSEEANELLILDEVTLAYNYQLIDQTRLLEFLKSRPQNLEIVMTGRDPAGDLIELADYVSEIRKVKHPFDQGIEARVGIEM